MTFDVLKKGQHGSRSTRWSFKFKMPVFQTKHFFSHHLDEKAHVNEGVQFKTIIIHKTTIIFFLINASRQQCTTCTDKSIMYISYYYSYFWGGMGRGCTFT